MSLLHPTVGEMYDRLVLLELKIEHGEKAGMPVWHFRQEWDELSAVIMQRVAPGNELVDELRAIHQALWDMIPTESSPALLKANAARYAIREMIDKAVGEYKGPEKV